MEEPGGQRGFFDMIEMAGKHIFIAGGSRGIGAAAAPGAPFVASIIVRSS